MHEIPSRFHYCSEFCTHYIVNKPTHPPPTKTLGKKGNPKQRKIKSPKKEKKWIGLNSFTIHSQAPQVFLGRRYHCNENF